ncbi:hypothetical protein GOODEAATRI_008605, partial [Goodea atripinnis]
RCSAVGSGADGSHRSGLSPTSGAVPVLIGFAAGRSGLFVPGKFAGSDVMTIYTFWLKFGYSGGSRSRTGSVGAQSMFLYPEPEMITKLFAVGTSMFLVDPYLTVLLCVYNSIHFSELVRTTPSCGYRVFSVSAHSLGVMQDSRSNTLSHLFWPAEPESFYRIWILDVLMNCFIF